MEKTVRVILMVVLVICFCLPAMAAEEWQLVKEEDGVSTYAREVEGSKYTAFKATTVIHNTMAAVGAVLRDVLNYPQWMAKVSETDIVKKHNANDMDVYVVMDFPWPTQDRDVVTQARTTIDPDTGDLIVNTTVLKDCGIPEKDGRVRIQELEQKFILRFIEMEKTEVEFSVHMEAGGNLPSMLVDAETQKVPSKSLINLQEVVQEDKYQQADPFNAINMPITKTITKSILGQHISDPAIIDLVINDQELIKTTMYGGYTDEGMENTARAIVKKYVKTPLYAEKIAGSPYEEELALLATDTELLEEVLEDDDIPKMIMTTGGMSDLVVGRLVTLIKDELD